MNKIKRMIRRAQNNPLSKWNTFRNFINKNNRKISRFNQKLSMRISESLKAKRENYNMKQIEKAKIAVKKAEKRAEIHETRMAEKEERQAILEKERIERDRAIAIAKAEREKAIEEAKKERELELEKINAEKEKQKIEQEEKEKQEREEQERIRQEKENQEREEQEKIRQEKEKQEREEQERIRQEKEKQEREEQERIRQEKENQEREEQERIRQEKENQERIRQEQEKEEQEKQKQEQERIKKEQEKQQQELLKQQRIEQNKELKKEKSEKMKKQVKEIVNKISKKFKNRRVLKLDSAMPKEITVEYSPKSYVSESFRTLRTNIQFMNVNKNVKSILVTSTTAGEGKSYTASNLAATFAQADKKVIIVDADMRKGRVHEVFKIAKHPGLSNYLSGFGTDKSDEETLNNYIKETCVENLFVLPLGNTPPNPSELIASEKMIQLIKILEEKFDVVIFDGTPSKIVTDSVILSREVDTTVIVTGHNQTKIEDLKKVQKDIENVGGNIAGVVINKVPVDTNKHSNSYYYENVDGTRKKTKKMYSL